MFTFIVMLNVCVLYIYIYIHISTCILCISMDFLCELKTLLLLLYITGHLKK